MIEKAIKYQGQVLHLLNDESVFYILGNSNNLTHFLCFDDNFNIILKKDIGLDINPNIPPLISDSYLYIYDSENNIYVLDKFSGTLANVVNLGMMTSVKGQYQDQSYIYSINKVPLSDVEKKQNSFSFNICKIDKEKNKKELQSCGFQNLLSDLYVYDDLLYIQTKEYIIVLNKDLKKVKQIALNWTQKCFIFKDYIISENGVLLDLNEGKRYFIDSDILLAEEKENFLFLITKNKIIHYNVKDKKEIYSKELFTEKVLYNNIDFYILINKNDSIFMNSYKQINHKYKILNATKKNNTVVTFDESRSLIKWHF